MIGPNSFIPRRIAIIGAGITGLAAAQRCLELAREQSGPLEVLLLEGSPRAGGVIQTEHRDGCLLEAGPDSFITAEKPWALALCKRLGIEQELIGTDDANRRSFVVRSGRLLPVPDGFQLLAPSRLGPFLTSPILSWPGKLRVTLDWLIPPRRAGGDESLASFVQRRLGREALERLAQPMVAGIYGADPERLSLQATLPRFLEMEQQHGSVIRAMLARRRQRAVPGSNGRPVSHPAVAGHPAAATGTSGARYGLFMSFRGGMQTLVDALVRRLPERSLRLSAPVQALAPLSSGEWQITLQDPNRTGATLIVDAVCLAVPAHRTAALIRSFDPALAAQLAGISYTSALTLNLAYPREDVPHPLDGFGFVVPGMEHRTILGCTFSSVKFPGRAPQGQVLLRAFVAGKCLEERDKGEIEAAVRADLRDLLGIRTAPLFSISCRHPNAMASYTVGHLDRVAAIEVSVSRYPGLALAGNAYHGIGVPDCIHSGEQAAERLIAARRGVETASKGG